MKKTWHFLYEHIPQQQVEALQQQLQIDKTLVQLLVQRNITTFEQAKKFFRPNVQQLHDPFLMKDMNKAIDFILKAIAEEKKILLYGDYDVDGTTSVACLYLFFQTHFPNAQVSYYIPNRLKDGYGLTQKGVAHILQQNINLVITLDCGIKSADMVAELKTKKIDTIICDHHLPDEHQMPPAIAIVNPKQNDCLYPFKELCACGITFKLITALLEKMQASKKFLNTILDFVALATSADIVPLVDENRIFVVEGIKKINTQPITSIKALKQISRLPQYITNHQLVFALAPRINAAGRMDTPDKAVELFLEKDFDLALQKAAELDDYNKQRKEIDTEMTIDATEIAAIANNNEHSFTTVVFQDNWHKGVLGIIASRLVETYYKPSIVLTKSNNVLVGSARSIPGFNMVEALTQCQHLLLGYGGHFYAAGLQMEERHLISFQQAFEAVAQTIFPQQPTPQIEVNMQIDFIQLNQKYINILQQFQPFGPLNMRPHLQTMQVSIQHIFIVKEKHLKFQVVQNGICLNAIYFGAIEMQKQLEKKVLWNIVYTVDLHTHHDTTELQLSIVDMQEAHN